MTCNDIDKIDSSIKDRRSRMKHKIYVDKPDYKEIDEIIGNKKISYMLYDKSLDNVYNAKEYLNTYGEAKTIEKLISEGKQSEEKNSINERVF